VNGNDLCVLELDYAAKEFSFEWKPFFTSFFVEYLYVGKRHDPLNPYEGRAR
jgi:hypothetical protein